MIFSGLSISDLLQNFIVLFTAITFHEYAHGWVANKLGDPTAKNMGRLTLNPIAHLDPIGALLMIFCRFGWAKPVPVNPYYFKDPKKDMALVAFAGPIANVIVAFLACTIYPLLWTLFYRIGIVGNVVADFVLELFISCASLNICFAIFNLIPFPPLDGSKILFSVLPNHIYNKLLQYERYGMIVLILLSLSGILSRILGYVINPIMSVFNAWISLIFNLIW
ncbi:MAG: site-2 protease family protein [Clostridia bacterium]|nr:site-2 protease family protein [Clostridia bacterium]